MKAYILTIIGITISIISLILFLTLGRMFFIPLIFILPLSGVCFTTRHKTDPGYFWVEPPEDASEPHVNMVLCPYCKRVIHEEYPRFCPHCGKLLNR
jgi:hypothetical protein